VRGTPQQIRTRNITENDRGEEPTLWGEKTAWLISVREGMQLLATKCLVRTQESPWYACSLIGREDAQDREASSLVGKKNSWNTIENKEREGKKRGFVRTWDKNAALGRGERGEVG